MNRLRHLHPVYWSTLFMVVSQLLALGVARQVGDFITENNVTVPEVSLGIPLLYFLGAVIVMGIVLFLIPMSKLKLLFRVIFSLLFLWGIFVDLTFILPALAAGGISLAVTLLWLFRPRIWLHDVLLLCSLAAMGAVFGAIMPAWTAMALMGVLSVYDILAVSFGYMMWMAKKLAQLDTLPAFVIPKDIGGWDTDMRKIRILDEESSERDFSVLGGGDIGFPLIMLVAVLFGFGTGSAWLMAGFILLGLWSVYLIQKIFLKGKPMAALPPLTVAGLIGFLIISFI